MTITHLEPAQLHQLLNKQLVESQVTKAVWHLARCGRCRAALASLSTAGRRLANSLGGSEAPPVPSSSYRESFEQVRHVLRQEAQREAVDESRKADLFAEFVALPMAAREEAITSSTRFHSYALVRLVLDKCRAEWTRHPRQSRALAESALAITQQLEAGTKSRTILHDLLAQCWAYLGNSKRVLTDFRGADAAFSRADKIIRSGTGDPMARGEVMDLKASLLREQRQFEPSIQLLARAASVYRKAGDRHLAGRTLLKQVFTYNEAGRPQESLAILDQAQDLLDESREPRLQIIVANQRIHSLFFTGRYGEALEHLPALRALAKHQNADVELIRADWIEARLLVQLNKSARAEELFQVVRAAFIQMGIGYEAALASLDLAALYLESGRLRETKQLAVEMLPIFQSRDIQREALAALMVFKRATELETVSVGMVNDISRYLRRAQSNPALRFEPAS